jgi:hypothetical protein
MAGTKNDAARTVELWQENPERSITAALGVRMLAGDWVTSEDAVELGGSPTLVTQAHQTLTAAGYSVEVGNRGGNARQYRVKAARRKARVEREDAGVTHPQLGAVLTVRALALDERGNLIVHLSNGNKAWAATITGHVA